MKRPPDEERRPGKGGVGPLLAGDRSSASYPNDGADATNVVPIRPSHQSVDGLLAAFAHLPESERYSQLHSHIADTLRLAEACGTPNEWTGSAIVHLKEQSSGVTEGGATVSAAALHLVLGYVEYLEGRLGVMSGPEAA